MGLLTRTLRKVLPPLYSQEKNPDPTVVAKFVTPRSRWEWYLIEGGRVDDDFTFFGLAKGVDEELGWFSLLDIEAVRGPYGLRIERDLHFKPARLSRFRTKEKESGQGVTQG